MFSISRMPEVPVVNDCQNPAVLWPSALITPVPVTTTRCMLFGGRRGGLRLEKMGDSFNHLVDVLDLLGFFVVDLDVEFTFEVEENIEAVQRVYSEGLEAAVGLNTFEGQSFRGRNDFENTILDGQA